MAGNCSFLTEKKPVCAAVPGVSSQNFLSFPVFFPQISLALFNRAGFVRLSLSESMQDEQEEESARAAAQ